MGSSVEFCCFGSKEGKNGQKEDGAQMGGYFLANGLANVLMGKGMGEKLYL